MLYVNNTIHILLIISMMPIRITGYIRAALEEMLDSLKIFMDRVEGN